MPRHRVVLLTLAIALLLPAAYLATKDVKFGERDCGTAVVPRDPNRSAVQTGDRSQDDFNEEVNESECGHRILAQRLLVLIPLAGSIALWIVSRRYEPRQPIPGDSLI